MVGGFAPSGPRWRGVLVAVFIASVVAVVGVLVWFFTPRVPDPLPISKDGSWVVDLQAPLVRIADRPGSYRAASSSQSLSSVDVLVLGAGHEDGRAPTPCSYELDPGDTIDVSLEPAQSLAIRCRKSQASGSITSLD